MGRWRLIGAFTLCSALLTGCSGNSDQSVAESESDIKIINPGQAGNQSSATGKVEAGEVTTHEHSHEASVQSEPLDDSAALDSADSGGVEGGVARDEIDRSNMVTLADQSESGYIEWNSPETLNYSQATLKVIAANGNQIERTFSNGEPMVLDVALPDGTYGWTSTVTPMIDASVREEMQAVRDRGDFEAENELKQRLRRQGLIPTESEANANKQSGTFVVKDGVAFPSYVDVPGSESRQDEEG